VLCIFKIQATVAGSVATVGICVCTHVIVLPARSGTGSWLTGYELNLMIQCRNTIILMAFIAARAGVRSIAFLGAGRCGYDYATFPVIIMFQSSNFFGLGNTTAIATGESSDALFSTGRLGRNLALIVTVARCLQVACAAFSLPGIQVGDLGTTVHTREVLAAVGTVVLLVYTLEVVSPTGNHTSRCLTGNRLIVVVQLCDIFRIAAVTAVLTSEGLNASCSTGGLQRYNANILVVHLGMLCAIAGMGCIGIAGVAFRCFRTSLLAGSVFVIYVVGEDVIQLRMCRVENRLGLGVTTIVTCCSLRTGLGAGCVFVVHIVGELVANKTQLQIIKLHRKIVLCVLFRLEQLLAFTALKVCYSTLNLAGGGFRLNRAYLVGQALQVYLLFLLSKCSIGKGSGIGLGAASLTGCIRAGDDHSNRLGFHMAFVTLTGSGSGAFFRNHIRIGRIIPIVTQFGNIIKRS